MNPSNPINSAGTRGFTLLELLVAIGIFAVVLTTIYASSTGTFRVVDETESQVEIYRMAGIAMERMLEDLESLYVSGGPSAGISEEGTESPYQFIGRDQEIDGRSADSLRFVSRAHVTFSGQEQDPGASEITYYVQERDGGEDFVLYRSDRTLFELSGVPTEETGGLVLCEGLLSVNFTYRGEDDEVRESWDSSSEELKGKVPRMVTVSLKFLDALHPGLPLTFMTSVVFPTGHLNSW